MSHRAAPGLCLLIATLLCACGGGGTAPASDVPFGEYPMPDEPSVPGPGTPPPDPGPPSPEDLVDGVLLTVESSGEIWHWWVTNPLTAQQFQEIWLGTRPYFSIGGVLRAGPGAGNHNAPWSWHVDPFENGVDVVTVPESPHTPSECESQLAFWLATGVTFIPAQAKIVDFDDRRLAPGPPAPR